MTELIWDGKYDDQGRKVAPPRIALPFQTVETINESAADRDRNQDLFASGNPTEWRNRLIWGDKKYVLPSLLEEFAGKVNLIYIDPPFATGRDFSFMASIADDPDIEGDQETTFVKHPSMIEQKAYRDTWGRGQSLDVYLKWFYETVALLRDLLDTGGSIYVHLDYNVGHYAKVVMDEVFGPNAFHNCIVWKRGPGKSHPQSFGHNTDYLMYYTKTSTYVWNRQFTELSQDYLATFKEDAGGRYVTAPLHSGKPAKNVPAWRGTRPPAGRGWAYKIETLEKFDAAGRIEWSGEGVPRLKRYESDIEGAVVQELWSDIKPILAKSGDHVGYATQKPEALLERVIKASSNEGDLILDCFCGSGTTAAVAEKLGRRWIACDLGRFAIHTTRKRLLGIPQVKPFVVQNLGKYERQAWQAAEFGLGAEAAAQGYRRFVLELYHAQPVSGYVWLHATKRGRMVHVGGVDAPVTMADVTSMVTEFRKAIGKGKDAPTRSGVDVLGWDFAFELNETAKQQAALAGIDLKLIRIPRDLLEKQAVEQGDIKFFELAALGVSVKKKARRVTLELTDFMIPLDDVPEEVQKAVTHWEQWIDYWAVDWDNSDDTFHNEWQAYRTRKDKGLARETSHTYAEPGKYRVVVKVIDILGNDTTKLLTVDVK